MEKVLDVVEVMELRIAVELHRRLFFLPCLCDGYGLIYLSGDFTFVSNNVWFCWCELSQSPTIALPTEIPSPPHPAHCHVDQGASGDHRSLVLSPSPP
jgi:hypothetical protein